MVPVDSSREDTRKPEAQLEDLIASKTESLVAVCLCSISGKSLQPSPLIHPRGLRGNLEELDLAEVHSLLLPPGHPRC